METIYYAHNGSRRSRQSRRSQTSRVSGRHGCTCLCNRDNGKNIVLIISLVMVLGLTAALLVIGLSTHRAYTTKEMEKEVELEASVYVELLNAGRHDAASEMYTTEGVIMAPGETSVIGRTAISKYLKTRATAARGQIADYRVTEVEIINDFTAFSTSEFETILGDVSSSKKKCLVIWKKVAGKWLMYREIYNNS